MSAETKKLSKDLTQAKPDSYYNPMRTLAILGSVAFALLIFLR
jgi:hypothetical protein